MPNNVALRLHLHKRAYKLLWPRGHNITGLVIFCSSWATNRADISKNVARKLHSRRHD